MAEAAILKVSLGVVQQILGSGLLKEFEMICGVRGDVENMKSQFTTLQSVLADANDLRVKRAAVDNWLKKVRDVTYQVDDVLDDFRFEALRREAETGNHALKKVRDFFSKSNQLVFLLHMGRKLKKVRHRLDLIANDRFAYNLNVQIPQPVLNAEAKIWFKDQERETVSSVMEPIIGREKDKEEIIKLLMTEVPNDEDVFSVIPIVGMGGVGKTTLAQLVYNDDVVKNTFDLHMWVCVSEDYNVKKLTKLLIDEASQTTRSERENQSATNIESLQQLHQRLQEQLSGKKFLLVLDDVWNVEWDPTWDTLKCFLKTGAKGSKIVVTTRFQEVASMMGENESYKLEVLSDECCWELFEKKALRGRRREERQELVSIGIEIVKKCRGSPLAAKALGSLMASKEDQSEWIAIRDSEFWCEKEVGQRILPSLMLSYHHLPPHLKPCFVYCALFSKDDEMDEKTLIWLWMAEGLILHSNDQMAEGLIPHSNYQNSEDIGKGYLKELVSRSLFQSAYGGYYVHDLVHDLAKHIAGNACLMKQVVGGSIKIPQFCYCLTLICDRYTIACLKEFCQTESVRTLIFKSNEHEQFEFEEVHHEMFIFPSKLRALHFQYCPIRELPDSISNLKHLRYIHLSNGRFKALPQSIGSLLNLQILAISYCVNLASLPVSLGGLLSLQTLTISYCHKLASLPASLGSLLNLQTLTISYCDKLASLPASLGSLLNLQIMEIFDCDNLASLPASLGGLQNLRTLTISHCDNLVSLPASLGDLLKLQTLTIDDWGKLASLPASLGSLLNLQTLTISHCYNLVSLPASLGGLLKLQVLEVNGSNQFESMPASIGDLQNLNVLRIIRCSKLQILPESMMKLQKLDCLDLRWTGLRELPSGMSNMTNLRNLENSGCGELTHMPKEMKKLNKLQKLSRFIVDEERGSNIAELQHLQLKGELEILSLGKLKDASAARAANLKEKGGLRRLHLFKGSDLFFDESLDDVAVEVLEGLEPPQNICQLQMSGGTEFPGWLNMGESSFPKLDHIDLFYFNRCKHLPTLGQLQLLKTLEIRGMSLIEVVGREFCGDNGDGVAFPSLNKITFEDLPRWKKWLISEEEDVITRQQSMAFTSLTQLSISKCPELTSLPSLPSLRELDFWICPELTSLPSLPSLRKLKIWESRELTSLPSLPSLKRLDISSCPKLTSLPSLPLLRMLQISWCPELTSLPSLPSLRQLQIVSCPELTSLSSPPSLQELMVARSMKLLKSEGSLRGVGSLKSLTITKDEEEVVVMKGLQDLSSVEELKIIGFGELACEMESMQHLLSTIQKMHISDNQTTTVLPETMRGLVSLQSLRITNCHRLSSLGEGLRGLVSLQSLEIEFCNRITSLGEGLRGLTALRELSISYSQDLGRMPEYMGSLTSLQSLRIYRCCPDLLGRCQREKGEDWHLISHIPNIDIHP